MKKLKYILMLFLFCIVCNVKALNCSSEELNRLRELANNIEFKQEIVFNNLDEEDKEMTDYVDVSYNLSIVNYNEDLDIYYKRINSDYYEKLDINELSNYFFIPGETVSFKIYSYTNNSCTNDLLTTKTVKFNYYNTYYYFHKDKCSEYPDFKYCKEFMEVDKSDEEIDKLFESYINGSVGDNINYFINTNILIYIIIGIVLISTIIIIYKKRKKKVLDI